jgi:hypothetical protein
MKKIKYIRHEFHLPPENREAYLYHFIIDIPYLLYFGVIPSIDVINEVLITGGDSGMSPGTEWEPFQINNNDYKKIKEYWKKMDINNELKNKNMRYNPIKFIEDEEILEIKNHLSYLEKSRKKYEKEYIKTSSTP